MGASSSSTKYATPDDVNAAIGKIQAQMNQMVAPYVTNDAMKTWVTAEIKTALPSLSPDQITNIANDLVANNAFLNNLSSQVSGAGNLSQNVAGALTGNANFNASLQAALIASPNLANNVANVLATTPTYAQKLQGPPGTIGTGNVTFGGTVTVPGTLTANGGISMTQGAKMTGANVLEFGSDVKGKQADAGKIGYGTFDNGASLNIVGAGNNFPRLVKLWDNAQVMGNLTGNSLTAASSLNVGNWSIYNNGNALCFKKPPAGDSVCFWSAGDAPDRLAVWMNSNNARPYFYVNGSGVADFAR